VALGVVKSARVTRELAKEQRKAEAAARSDDAAA
jgi:hypothetical protein